MTNVQAQSSSKREYWETAPELPLEVFAVLQKPNGAINPVAIVATVDPDGFPRTAPFGSLRAVTPKLLRLISMRHHDTFGNLTRDGRVVVAVLAPPDIAVSIRGRSRVVKEHMTADEHSAILEIDIEVVKNDMVRSGIVESAITFSPLAGHLDWFRAALSELEDT